MKKNLRKFIYIAIISFSVLLLFFVVALVSYGGQSSSEPDNTAVASEKVDREAEEKKMQEEKEAQAKKDKELAEAQAKVEVLEKELAEKEAREEEEKAKQLAEAEEKKKAEERAKKLAEAKENSKKIEATRAKEAETKLAKEKEEAKAKEAATKKPSEKTTATVASTPQKPTFDATVEPETYMYDWDDLPYEERVLLIEHSIAYEVNNQKENGSPIKVVGTVDQFIKVIDDRSTEIKGLKDNYEQARMEMTRVSGQVGVVGYMNHLFEFDR